MALTYSRIQRAERMWLFKAPGTRRAVAAHNPILVVRYMKATGYTMFRREAEEQTLSIWRS